MDEKIKRLRQLLPQEEILCQLAEECAELSQAALKLRRTMDGTNPTPVTKEEAWQNFIEEFSDVIGCMKVLRIPSKYNKVKEINEYKFERWIRRLEARE